MGGVGSGSQPDIKRRRKAAELRRQGLTLQEIGDRLGCSRECVRQLAQDGGYTAPPRHVVVRCRRCRAEITRGNFSSPSDKDVLCLGCLAQTPRATIGQRLKAHRLAQGLGLRELARRVGVSDTTVSNCERGRHQVRPETLERLFEALGVAVPRDRKPVTKGKVRT